MSPTTRFVHLRVHSEYSLEDSVLSVSALLDQVVQLNMPAVGLADQSNVFAAVKFYREAVKRGIKPIVGADLWIAAAAEDRDPSRLTLLCLDEEGFRNLSRLLTLSYADGRYLGRALVLKEWLEPDKLAGLVELSGGQSGEPGGGRMLVEQINVHPAIRNVLRPDCELRRWTAGRSRVERRGVGTRSLESRGDTCLVVDLDQENAPALFV